MKLSEQIYVLRRCNENGCNCASLIELRRRAEALEHKAALWNKVSNIPDNSIIQRDDLTEKARLSLPNWVKNWSIEMNDGDTYCGDTLEEALTHCVFEVEE